MATPIQTTTDLFDFTIDEKNILACFNLFNGTNYSEIKDIPPEPLANYSGTTNTPNYHFKLSDAVRLVASGKVTNVLNNILAEIKTIDDNNDKIRIAIEHLRELADTTGIKMSGPYEDVNIAMITDMLRKTDRLEQVKANMVTPVFKPKF